jgi:hypothetical protein
VAKNEIIYVVGGVFMEHVLMSPLVEGMVGSIGLIIIH